MPPDEKRLAKIEDVRIHDLLHTFASIGAGGGIGLPLIGGILSHKQASTTQRYAHLADMPLRVAADVIGNEIAASLAGAFTPNSRERNQTIAIHTTEKRSQLAHCLAAAPVFHLREEEALGIMTAQIRCIRLNWRSVCDSAGLTEIDRAFFWRRQFLNPYALEGLEEVLANALDGL